LPTGSAPFQSSTQLARSSAAPHGLHDLRVFPSGLKEPQSRVFARSVKRDLARLGNREIATVLERGAGLITTLGDLGVVSCGIVRQVFAVATTLPKNHLPHMKGCARQIAGP
jgi:hypothetical protein